MSNPRDTIVTVMSLYNRLSPTRLTEIVASHPGCEDPLAVSVELMRLIDDGAIVVDDGLLRYVEKPNAKHDEDMKRYLSAVDAYRCAMLRKSSLWSRVCAALWRIRYRWLPGFIAAYIFFFFTLGLCAVEVPDSVVRGVVAVESGSTWNDIGNITGGWKCGSSGEVSHFQLSASVLTDLKLTPRQRARVTTSPIYAESIARLWLVRCFERTGNWRDALARYHAGSNYRRDYAQEYARRVLSL